MGKIMMTADNISGFDIEDMTFRFKNKISYLTENECWEWKGAKISNGRSSAYGLFNYRNRRCRAHKFMWLLVNGYFPTLMVCHSCDNTLCCNPKHLFLGTALDNHNDMKRKGRGIEKEKHPKRVLSEEQVSEIRTLSEKSGMSQRKIAKLFGVSRGCVTGIIYNINWK